MRESESKSAHWCLRFAVLLSAAYTGMVGTVYAQTAEQAVKTYNISAGDLGAALNTFSDQSGLQVLFDAGLVKDLKAPGIQGQFSPSEVLARLLKGTGLEPSYLNERAIIVKKTAGAPKAQKSGAAVSGSKETSVEKEQKALDTVTVTGSRIRGGDTPSSVITIDSQQMYEEGSTDLGEVIRNVTENFRGGQNPGVVNGSTSNIANQNQTGGSGLNLRGLGPDASLTLLNGKRMTYDGFGGAIDISAIPIEAVDRVEIVADGASAIYGSDAVAGVGNVILKRDFDGATVGVRYGAATEGGMATREVTATAGTTWSSGGVIATYKSTSADPIYATQRDYTQYLTSPYSVYSGLDTKSELVSAHQSIGDSVEMRLDAFNTERDNTDQRGYGSYYILFPAHTRTSFVSPSLEISLPGDWSMSMYATLGRSNLVTGDTYVAQTAAQVPAPFKASFLNESHSYEVSAEGPLFSLSGGEARLAVGAGYRLNDYLYTSSAHYGGDQSNQFGYAELSLPFVGPDSGVAGIHRLEFTAAVRGEHYSTFGGVTTPKLGAIYDPDENFTLKTSWGKSFKAPTLEQQYNLQQAILYPAGLVGGSAYPAGSTAIIVAGGNPDLKPERANGGTASVAFHPQAIPNLDMDLTWFDISYRNRVVYPIPFANFSQALTSPLYSDFVESNPSAEEQEKILALPLSYNQFYNYSGGNYDPTKVVATINDLYTNATRQQIKGLDFSGSYRIDLDEGRVTIRGSISWLDSVQQTTAAQSTYDLSGTLFNPARLNSRIGAVWTHGGFTTSFFANYTGGVTDTVAERKGASYTAFDSVIGYTAQTDSGIWSGTKFALSVQNLFDRRPPFYSTFPTYAPPYDSTNYSAIGRFVSISASKHW